MRVTEDNKKSIAFQCAHGKQSLLCAAGRYNNDEDDTRMQEELMQLYKAFYEVDDATLERYVEDLSFTMSDGTAREVFHNGGYVDMI